MNDEKPKDSEPSTGESRVCPNCGSTLPPRVIKEARQYVEICSNCGEILREIPIPPDELEL